MIRIHLSACRLTLMVWIALTISACASTGSVLEQPESQPNHPRILSVEANRVEVPCYENLELFLLFEATYDNPYNVRQVDLTATFTGPDGSAWTVPGFWDGEDAWRGVYLAEFEATTENDRLVVALPDFERDVAVKFEYQ